MPVESSPKSPLRLLMISPTTRHPAMIGDARRVYGLAKGCLENNLDCVYVGKDFVYRGDHDICPIAGQGRDRSRLLNGLVTLFNGGHYNETRHCTQRWRQRVTHYLSDQNVDVIYCHFLFTYPLISDLIGDRVLVIDTHNSEWDWYEGFSRSTRNPLVRRICRTSQARAETIMGLLPAGTLMAHVSPGDSLAYQNRRPDLIHLVVPNGGDFEPRVSVPDYRARRKRLLFFGSLHGKMSVDALSHFARVFWPSLSDVAQVVVAGANPCRAVHRLCRQYRWELRSNLPQCELTPLFESVHYAILPFTYGAGSKLKFFDACLRGVPVLTTEAGACGQQDLPQFVNVSNDPFVWRDFVLTRTALDAGWRDEVVRFGERYNWKSIAGRMIEPIQAAVRSRRAVSETGTMPAEPCPGAID